MLSVIAQSVVLLFGVAAFAACALGLYAPGKFVRLVINMWEKDWGMHMAVLVRLILGVSLILAASGSRFPVVFMVLGIATIIAAIAIVLVGAARVDAVVRWLASGSPVAIRLWLLFGMAFGAFLTYGVLPAGT